VTSFRRARASVRRATFHHGRARTPRSCRLVSALIATKFGNIDLPDGRKATNGRPEYVQACCEASLKRLGMDVIEHRRSCAKHGPRPGFLPSQE
jgi:hypothetical protein